MPFLRNTNVKFGQFYNKELDRVVPFNWQVVLTLKDRVLLLATDKLTIPVNFPKSERNRFYSTSVIRKYLQEEFYQQAFNQLEQDTIIPTYNMNRGCYGRGSSFEEATLDTVFTLSIDDGMHLMLGNQRSGRYLEFTNKSIFGTYLRTPGEKWGYFAYVDKNGRVDTDGKMLENQISVLPAIWVDKNNLEEYLKIPCDLPSDSVISFGHYNNKEIKWDVIEYRHGVYTLLCQDILLEKEMSESGLDCSWATSSLRQWLNTEFLQQAFSKEEQDKLLLQNVITSSFPRSSKNGLPNCKDYVTLLDYKEFLRLDNSLKNLNAEYWLRNHGNVGSADKDTKLCDPFLNWQNIVHNSFVHTMVVDAKGDLNNIGYYPGHPNGVRPVVQIKL